MDITWGAIGKVLIAGLATYVFLPAALVLRDMLLWKLIEIYILNSKLREQIRRYAILINLWNKDYTGTSNISTADHRSVYTKDGEELSAEEWAEFRKGMESVKSNMEEAGLYIKRKSNFLNWLLKHYKQDATNPIDEWLKKDIETLKNHEGN